MCKRLLSLFLIMLLLSTVAGCISNGEIPSNSDTEQTSSQVDTDSDETAVSETTGSEPETINTEDISSTVTTETEEHTSADTENSIPQEEKTPVVISKPETKSNESASSKENPATPTVQTTTKQQEESEPTVITEPPKPAEPYIPPITAESPKPPEEPVTPKFDIDYWINFAKEYAVSIDLKLSPTAVECWDNPIIAGSHCKYLERDITDCLSRYKNFEGFTGVWIWAEPDGKGAYKLYIGYE